MEPWTRRQFFQRGSFAGCWVASQRLAGQVVSQASPVVLQTEQGALRGQELNGVRVFRGVPFAEPPVGELRFRPPVSKRPWSGVHDATHFGAAAVQQGDRSVPQSEDCLYLNVWAPKQVSSAARLPVFVWIHGGGFTGGEAFADIFDGTSFAQQGIVVVTVAYRLGVLGFLDLGPLLGVAYAGSANNALRDLMLALEWVKGNIEAFGGDLKQVTVGGESAGAKLTDLLLGVPAAKDLFRGAISESGGAERIWPKSTAEKVAEGFGAQWRAASGQSHAELKTAPARQLIDVQTEFLKTWPQHFPLRCELDGVLMPRPPIETIALGSAAGRRLLIGTNRDESALFLGAHPQHDPTAADLGNMSLPAFETVFAKYASLYPDMTEEQRRIRAVTAEEYWVPSTRVADAAVRAGAQVWAYELEFARSGGAYKGEAFHSEDIGLVWDKPGREYDSAAAEAALATQIHTAWASFLRGEAPAAPGLPVWQQYTAETRATMMLDRVSRMEAKPQGAELALWGTLQPLPGR